MDITTDPQWQISSPESFKKEVVAQIPVFIQPISSCAVQSGETVRFVASVSSLPKPEIRWFHNQKAILSSKNIVFHFDESTNTAILIIVDAFVEHAGVYTCKARNSAGEVSCAATLTVTSEGKALPSSAVYFETVVYTLTNIFHSILFTSCFGKFSILLALLHLLFC